MAKRHNKKGKQVSRPQSTKAAQGGEANVATAVIFALLGLGGLWWFLKGRKASAATSGATGANAAASVASQGGRSNMTAYTGRRQATGLDFEGRVTADRRVEPLTTPVRDDWGLNYPTV